MEIEVLGLWRVPVKRKDSWVRQRRLQLEEALELVQQRVGVSGGEEALIIFLTPLGKKREKERGQERLGERIHDSPSCSLHQWSLWTMVDVEQSLPRSSDEGEIVLSKREGTGRGREAYNHFLSQFSNQFDSDPQHTPRYFPATPQRLVERQRETERTDQAMKFCEDRPATRDRWGNFIKSSCKLCSIFIGIVSSVGWEQWFTSPTNDWLPPFVFEDDMFRMTESLLWGDFLDHHGDLRVGMVGWDKRRQRQRSRDRKRQRQTERDREEGGRPLHQVFSQFLARKGVLFSLLVLL
jgi:hypothetical protein